MLHLEWLCDRAAIVDYDQETAAFGRMVDEVTYRPEGQNMMRLLTAARGTGRFHRELKVIHVSPNSQRYTPSTGDVTEDIIEALRAWKLRPANVMEGLAVKREWRVNSTLNHVMLLGSRYQRTFWSNPIDGPVLVKMRPWYPVIAERGIDLIPAPLWQSFSGETVLAVPI